MSASAGRTGLADPPASGLAEQDRGFRGSYELSLHRLKGDSLPAVIDRRNEIWRPHPDHPMIVSIVELRPTQITVGYREVERKRRKWRQQTRAGERLASSSLIPVVLGPKHGLFVIDHHHMVRALHDEGVGEVAVSIFADLGMLAIDEFWEVCETRGWCHPYDAAGERQPKSAIPATIGDLANDTYRSLAGELRRAGGYAKASTPYSEFKWADFLRGRIDHAVAEGDFDHAIEIALGLVNSTEAQCLPGRRS